MDRLVSGGPWFRRHPQLAGLVTAARPDLGLHAGPLRDGLQSLQRAFREASREPDEPGEGPGEKLTGPVC